MVDDLTSALKMSGATSGEMMFNAGVDACAAGKRVTIDALVAALEPFANMPMPDRHGVERERIHKARAALALARGGK